LVPIALGASTAITKRTREFVVLTLLLEAGMLGAFVATDLFLFFVFFEAMLIPMYFIIGVWGSDRRIYAAFKFFVYTFFGSALMLARIIVQAVIASSQIGAAWGALTDLASRPLTLGTALLLLAAFAMAVAVKVPTFQLHTCQRDADS